MTQIPEYYKKMMSGMGIDPSTITSVPVGGETVESEEQSVVEEVVGNSSTRKKQITGKDEKRLRDFSGLKYKKKYSELEVFEEEGISSNDNDSSMNYVIDETVSKEDDMSEEEKKMLYQNEMYFTTNNDQIYSKIAKDLNIPITEVRHYVNHFFNHLRTSMSKMEYSSYHVFNFGTFNALPVRGAHAQKATESHYKINKKGLKNESDFEEKDGLIQEIMRDYPADLLLNTSHRGVILYAHQRKNVILGYNYKKLYKRYTAQQLRNLIIFLKKLSSKIKN